MPLLIPEEREYQVINPLKPRELVLINWKQMDTIFGNVIYCKSEYDLLMREGIFNNGHPAIVVDENNRPVRAQADLTPRHLTAEQLEDATRALAGQLL